MSRRSPVSVVVLSTAATRHLQRRTLPSILRTVGTYCQSRNQVIVVHNGFEDLPPLDERVTVISSRRPLQVAHGYNLGIEACTNDVIVLMHDDVELRQDDWLEICLQELEQPGTGAVGPVLHEIGGPMYCKGLRYPYLQCVPLVTTRQVLDHVGLFDEQFFQGLEDVDWNYRLVQAGYTLAIVPFAVVHRQGLSTRRLLGRGFPLHCYWHAVAQRYYPRFFRKHRDLLGPRPDPGDLFDDGIGALLDNQPCLGSYLRALALLFAADQRAVTVVDELVRRLPGNLRIEMLAALAAVRFDSPVAEELLRTFRDRLEAGLELMPARLRRRIAGRYVVSPSSMLAWACFHLGRLQHRRGSAEAAVASWRRAAEQETWYPSWLQPAVLLYTGIVAREGGLNVQALLQQVREIDANGPFSRAALDLANTGTLGEGRRQEVETACLFVS